MGLISRVSSRTYRQIMYSTIASRANSLSTVIMYAFCAVAAAAFFTTHYLEKSTETKLHVHKAVVKRIQEFDTLDSLNDAAFLTFDLEVDTKDLFNWNVKQLFMYLVVTYQTDKNDINEVVIWDKIVWRKDMLKKKKSTVTYTKAKNKYYFFDD